MSSLFVESPIYFIVYDLISEQFESTDLVRQDTVRPRTV